MFKHLKAGFLYAEGMEYERAKEFEKAISAYDQAILLTPNDADIYSGKGIALFGLGKEQEAITAYDKAIEQP